MKQDEIEYGLIYHNICPRTRESEMLLERVRQRFGLDSRGLKLMAGAAPVLVKRLVQRNEASYLKDIFDSIGAVTWIQELPPGQRFQDRRQQVRRQVLDRRGAYRHNVSVPERRYGGGRRRDDFGLGRENWRGLVL